MYILKEVSQHWFAYLILILLLGSGFWAYFYLSESQFYQQLVILGLTISYFLWGITTHVKSDRLTRFIVEEYAAIAVLGGLLLLLLTF